MNSRSDRRALLPLLAVAVALSGCATSRTGIPGSAGASPSAASSAGPSASTAAQAAQGSIGRNGPAAWSITPQGVYISTDAGRSFSQLSLPANVAPANVMAVAARADGHIWLAADTAGGPSFAVYARKSVKVPWEVGTPLTPSWPPNLGGAERQPGGVSIIPGDASQVLVVSELQLSHSTSIPRMFVSADGGTTYAQRVFPTPSDVNSPWDSIAIMGTNAVGVTGERFRQIVHSSDTAATWTSATINGVTASDFVAGTPVFSGATVYLPVTEPDANNNGAFILLRSTDGGATFNADHAQMLSLGGSYDDNPTAVASAGASWWVVSPAGTVYRSTDNGLSWSKAAGVLPQGVASIGATDSQNATVTVEHNACATGKTDCSSDQYFETTSDGGKTWTQT